MSFQKRLQAHEFVVLAEMHTPKGVNISRLMTDARRIKGRIDAVVIPDMDNGIMRMSAIAGGVLMQQQGVEAIIHTYCRDRNRMALQGDILAAHVLGIQNLIVAHSEEMSQGDHSDAKTVADLDEIGLLGAIRQLQAGRDLAGFDLDGIPSFTVGCTIAPCADAAELEAELAVAARKIEAGAMFVITPPVFDLSHFATQLPQFKKLGVPVIPTVFLLKSLAIAQYIANSEPGAHISDELTRRIRKSSDREQEGIQIAGETVAALKTMTEGVMIQTLGWEHKLPAILDIAGI
ncbi:methylenetetrahydrofolate reductase [Desulfoprunum benzoelyticum]|uniref:Methylenetetrahydrofolate reductase n=1 Tax=Desulfoprunum benzoelyticum TaxID=1506996 RepID=A0A840V145_9BACT|nr:methylenetetrahydrofolate reductase [Desulfoprunum benzoelyticum]MBB5347540.1 5,10-methylenetetrahydrofolate reductase [Desulfoprunum benzoelyticum]MBM9531659.1 methylenetetrahydrofolate reductase [Desulfoprunum benzoelyticum]